MNNVSKRGLDGGLEKPQHGSKPVATTSLPVVYILGLKKRGEEHYGLTTWMGNAPLVYAVYDRNPGYWADSEKLTPIAIADSPQSLEKRKDWSYIGFGWAKGSDGKVKGIDMATNSPKGEQRL